jgi:hypothetical protein
LSILQRAAALDQINDQHDHGDDEKQMDEVANVEREPEKPEYEKNNEDGPKHRNSFG